MNEKEKEIMDLLIQAHNKYVLLKPTHPSDVPDWADGIHRLQDILNRRIIRRDYPEDFITVKDYDFKFEVPIEPPTVNVKLIKEDIVQLANTIAQAIKEFNRKPWGLGPM